MIVTPSVLVAPVSVIVDTMIVMASATTVLGLVHYVSNSYSNSSDSNSQCVGGTCQCNGGIMIAMASATTVLGLVHYVSNSYSYSSDSNSQCVGGTCQCNGGYYVSNSISDNIAWTCTLRK